MEEVGLSEEVVRGFDPVMATRDNCGYVNSLSFSEDGTLLMTSADDDTMHIYNVSSGVKERLINEKAFGCAYAKFTADQNVICANRKGKVGIIRHISTFDQSVISTYVAHEGPVTSIDVGLYSTYISTGKDNILNHYDFRQKLSIGEYEYKNNTGTGLCKFDPTSSTIFIVHPYSQSNNRTYVKILDGRNLKTPFKTLDIYCPDVVNIDTSDDGRILLLSTCRDTVVALDAFTGGTMQSFTDYENSNGNCQGCISYDSQWVAITSEKENTVKVFNADTGEAVQELQGHMRTPHCISWDKNNAVLASACWNVILWAVV